MINYKIIIRLLGLLLIIEGIAISIASLVSFFYKERDAYYILLSAIITSLVGTIMFYYTRNANKIIKRREGFLLVSLAWITFSLFGALPFFITRKIPSFTDAYFETMSGFTTTGASILTNIESLGYGLHFWRSFTQWLGGLGFVMLTIAIVPMLGIGAMQLYQAEVPGLETEKLHPKIKETAQRLWGIYIMLTLLETLLLWYGGMTPFDAICHSFTTLSTGGFSTKQASIAYWDNPFIHYVITIFMFLGGINFSLFYYLFKLKINKVWSNEEFRYYFFIVISFTILITILLHTIKNIDLENSFRLSIFQVVSIMTTTGFCTADYYGNWGSSIWIFIVMLMFIGGCAGSTGGSIKVVRILLIIKNSIMELRRIMHPNAIVPLRYNKLNVSQNTATNIYAFFIWYLALSFVSVLLLLLMKQDLHTSFGAVIASIGNIGPGIGKVGPVGDYSQIPDLGKWLLSFLMMVGRLEIFTVILLFSRAYWRK